MLCSKWKKRLLSCHNNLFRPIAHCKLSMFCCVLQRAKHFACLACRDYHHHMRSAAVFSPPQRILPFVCLFCRLQRKSGYDPSESEAIFPNREKT
uniref:Uncharacterized protein n=1 Tax=Aegilops tauschii subsp. strangulata TaxID=200361 RepID=A0A453LL04_AEGTS